MAICRWNLTIMQFTIEPVRVKTKLKISIKICFWKVLEQQVYFEHIYNFFMVNKVWFLSQFCVYKVKVCK